MLGLIGDGPLARAARSAGLDTRTITLDEPVREGVSGLLVDVAIEERAAVVAQCARAWRTPVLVEAPIAPTAQAAREIGELDAVVAANPLRYGLHSRRLLEELHPVEDPLETFFAAWRVRAGSGTHTLLPLLLDYVREICPERVERVSAMGRVDLSVMTVTLRYASGVLGSLEVGEHLPREFPSEMELVVECFCRETILHCLPGRQAVEVAGRTSTRTDWQPDAYGGVVNAFAEWLNGGPRPHGSIQRDVEALRLADSILQAAHAGNVRVLGD